MVKSSTDELQTAATLTGNKVGIKKSMGKNRLAEETPEHRTQRYLSQLLRLSFQLSSLVGRNGSSTHPISPWRRQSSSEDKLTVDVQWARETAKPGALSSDHYPVGKN